MILRRRRRFFHFSPQLHNLKLDVRVIYNFLMGFSARSPPPLFSRLLIMRLRLKAKERVNFDPDGIILIISIYRTKIKNKKKKMSKFLERLMEAG